MEPSGTPSMVASGFLIDVDYRNIRGRSVPRLHFVSKEGNYFNVLDWSFRPYFILLLKESDSLDDATVLEKTMKATVTRVNELARRREATVHSHGHGKLKLHGTPRRVVAISCNLTSDVVALRDDCALLPSVEAVLEADILYHVRYIVDKDLVPCGYYEVTASSSGALVGLKYDSETNWTPRILTYDIETVRERGFPKASENPIALISITTENGTVVLENKGNVNKNDSDASVLKEFIDIVNKEDPDCIATYNGDGFDWPYLVDRGRVNNIAINIARDGTTPFVRPRRSRDRMTNDVKITGRIPLDCYPMVVRDFKNITIPLGRLRVKGQYDLKTVSEFLGVKKKDDRELLPPEHMWEVWHNDRDRFKEYAKDDSEATQAIAKKLIVGQISLSKVIRMPLKETVKEDRGRQVENFFIYSAKRNNELVPNKQYDNETGDGPEYDGAKVLDPIPGIHDNVTDLDFTSLYPTIMIKHNIGTDTLLPIDYVGDCHETPFVEHKFSKDKTSLVAGMLRSLLDEREVVKTKIKTEKDETEKKFLEEVSTALKVVANSTYGYLGWVKSRWYKKECAESVTAWGRYYINEMSEIAKRHKYVTIFGDTDSVFIKPVHSSSEHITVEDLIDDINGTFPVEVKLEEVLPVALFLSQKKRYCALKNDGTILVRGLEVRRGDWCIYSQQAQAAIIEHLLTTKDVGATIQLAKDWVSTLNAGHVPIENLIIRKGMKKAPKDYKAKMAQVEAYKRMEEQYGDNMPYDVGDKIPMIVVTPSSLGKRHGAGMTECAVTFKMYQDSQKTATPMKIDIDYYVNSQLMATMMRILEVVGADPDIIKGRPAQKTLSEIIGADI